jgi:hypothetical protein
MEGCMKAFCMAMSAALLLAAGGLSSAVAGDKDVCLKVDGEKIEILNLDQAPIIVDRDGIPDFVPTSMLKSVATEKETKDYNVLVSGVKRDDKKAITSFEVRVGETAYSYPKNSCAK